MLTTEDIKKLIEAEKEVFPTFDVINKKFDEMHQNFSQLQSSVDGIAKQITTYHQEMISFTHKVDRMEDWIKQASEKLGIPYNP